MRTATLIGSALFMLVLVAPIANSAPLLSLSAELRDGDGEILSETSGSLKFESPVHTLKLEASTVPSGPSATVEGTFDKVAIRNYAATLADPGGDVLKFVGDTRWIAKIGATVNLQTFYDTGLQIVACCSQIHLGPQAYTVERTTEKYALWAIAPNSVSGFVPFLNEPGNEIRFNVQFFSEVAWPQDFTNNLFAPFGDGPYLDFRGEFFDTLSLMNQGHYLVVDLDALGVSVGETYGFAEDLWFEAHLPLIGGPQVPPGIASEAFLTIDPVFGMADALVSAPPTGWLLLLAAFLVTPRRRKFCQ